MFGKNEQMPCLTCFTPIFWQIAWYTRKANFRYVPNLSLKGYTFDTVKENKEGDELPMYLSIYFK